MTTEHSHDGRVQPQHTSWVADAELPGARLAPVPTADANADADASHRAVADLDDAELLRRHVEGDCESFEQLYDRHDRACFHFIRRLLGPVDAAIAEDLHQETWLAVARSGAGFDPTRARFVTWLFSIARNRVMDHFRHHANVVHLSHTTDDEDAAERIAADGSMQPERQVERGAMAHAILREVEALPLVQRETFILFSFDELSLQEIADVTGVGAETVKSRLRYARITLRQRLADWSPHDV